MKWLLIAFAVAALWFSTVVGYTGSEDVRSSIVVLTVVALGVKANCSSGRRKCFYLAFFLSLLVTALFQGIMAPQMRWVYDAVNEIWPIPTADTVSPYLPDDPVSKQQMFATSTIILAADLILATLAGLIGIKIYDQGQKDTDH